MSEIRVTNIIGETGTDAVNFTKGVNVTGIVTATSFAGSGAALTGISGFDPSNHMVLEEFCSPCDGSVIALQDGNHTLTQPTVYGATDTLTDIVGSVFTYTPPSGTSQVVYDYRFTISNNGGSEPLLSFALYLDSNEVTKYRRVFRAQYEFEYSVRWGFNIGGSADTTTGRVASWTSAKTMKVQVCRYSSSYPAILHETNHWTTGSTDQFNAPTLTIKAIGTQAS